MEPKLAEDLMVGAKPIAEFMGLPVRQIFYLAETGRLPLFKIGNKWAARKSAIERHLANLENGKAA
jgi:hypothetical protein